MVLFKTSSGWSSTPPAGSGIRVIAEKGVPISTYSQNVQKAQIPTKVPVTPPQQAPSSPSIDSRKQVMTPQVITPILTQQPITSGPAEQYWSKDRTAIPPEQAEKATQLFRETDQYKSLSSGGKSASEDIIKGTLKSSTGFGIYDKKIMTPGASRAMQILNEQKASSQIPQRIKDIAILRQSEPYQSLSSGGKSAAEQIIMGTLTSKNVPIKGTMSSGSGFGIYDNKIMTPNAIMAMEVLKKSTQVPDKNILYKNSLNTTSQNYPQSIKSILPPTRESVPYSMTTMPQQQTPTLSSKGISFLTNIPPQTTPRIPNQTTPQLPSRIQNLPQPTPPRFWDKINPPKPLPNQPPRNLITGEISPKNDMSAYLKSKPNI